MKCKSGLSDRHREALQYSINRIKKSDLNPYVRDVILYGSCARGEADWNSDVDLLLVLDPAFDRQKRRLLLMNLRGFVSSPDISVPDTDIHITIGDDWETSGKMYYQNIRKDGRSVWS